MYISPKDFNNGSVEVLNSFFDQHDTAILENTRRLVGMLKDYDPLGKFEKEILLLQRGLECNLPRILLNVKADYENFFDQLVGRVKEKCYLVDEAAEWVVSAWAKALEIPGAGFEKKSTVSRAWVAANDFENEESDTIPLFLGNNREGLAVKPGAPGRPERRVPNFLGFLFQPIFKGKGK